MSEQIEPEPGDFFTTSTRGRWYDRFCAWVIKWFTARRIRGGWVDAPVNHAGLLVAPGVIVEAVGEVRYGTPDEYPDAAWSSGRLPAALTPTPEQRRLIVGAAHDMVGDGYNWPDLLAIGLAQDRARHVVTSRTWWAQRLSSEKTVICSELVARVYSRAGIVLIPGVIPGLISPEDLDALLTPDTAGG